MIKVCICGGGSLGHVLAGFLASQSEVEVNILTSKPDQWKHSISINTPEGTRIEANLAIISDNPARVIPRCNIIILCLPGFAISQMLIKIKPYVSSAMYVGSVFSSTGFFFEALNILDHRIPLWGFQRVPFIARITKYGESADLLGYKPSYNIAIENSDQKESFRKTIEKLFKRDTYLLNNYYEASFTNSNPILHPARLYSLFKDWKPGKTYDHHILFYEEWSDEASELLIGMDAELFAVLKELPVSPTYLLPILEYYESNDAKSLSRKLRSIDGFKGIKSPMIEQNGKFIPDFKSRYFSEDFPYGLRYIYSKAKELGIKTPIIDTVYQWGMSLI